MRKLFGTDGIRGVAGEFPLDDRTIFVIGESLARYYGKELKRSPRFITGRDTRESGPNIEAVLHSAISSCGAVAVSAGVITTPGVAYLTKAGHFDAGVVISASHNPFQDNGIKIFTPSGQKAGSEVEKFIEAAINSPDETAIPDTIKPLNESTAEKFSAEYIDHLQSGFASLDLSGKKLVVDCANGAASGLAPELFQRFGTEAVAINNTPDGRNINENCGSLHLEQLQERVIAEKADAGIAFDGDADRCLFVDENGKIVDGDATLWIVSNYLLEHGKLKNRKVVATVMSNIGLEIALREKGIELVRTPVGDKYVLDELLQSGSELGGEQSGHVIFPEMSNVGDGMLTALVLLKAVTEKRLPLSAMTEGFRQYPQILVNVKVREKLPFDEVESIRTAAARTESTLAGNGRLLLRYSGTENLARVMIEGRDQAEIAELANHLADTIRTALG